MKTINRDEIISYLRQLKPQLEKEGIDRIGLFGSFAKGKEDLASDIDIVIRTTPLFVAKKKGIHALLYLEDLRNRLSTIFGRPVDISDEAGLKKPMEESIYA